ncbi:hypothetical protein ACOJQI_21400 [Bacillus salacetis]|uniref:hypothetical protein n=1 Tax=Bacillus salacetis TaxID=2315464 RepID=UPI003B9F86D6
MGSILKKEELPFRRIDLSKLTEKEQKRYTNKMILLHWFSKINKKAPISSVWGDTATRSFFLAIRKDYFPNKAIVFNGARGNLTSLEAYYDVVHETVETPKEVQIRNTTYIYDIAEIKIKMMISYDGHEFIGEFD